ADPGPAEGVPVLDVGVPAGAGGPDYGREGQAGGAVREVAPAPDAVRDPGAVPEDLRRGPGSADRLAGVGVAVDGCAGALPGVGRLHPDVRGVAGGDPELLRRRADEWAGGGGQQQGPGDCQAGLRPEVSRQLVDPAGPGLEPGEGRG